MAGCLLAAHTSCLSQLFDQGPERQPRGPLGDALPLWIGCWSQAPNDASAWSKPRANVQLALGPHAEAAIAISKAMELEPSSLVPISPRQRRGGPRPSGSWRSTLRWVWRDP